MHTCRQCRNFSSDPGVAVGGSIEIGRCRLGDYLIAPTEAACAARTLDAGEIVSLRNGGFALVAENQPAGAATVIVRKLHMTERVARRELVETEQETANTNESI